jgi:hypothetical protein
MDNENSIGIETLLAVTRQNLVKSIIANTELEALVQELKTRIQELESKKKEEK